MGKNRQIKRWREEYEVMIKGILEMKDIKEVVEKHKASRVKEQMDKILTQRKRLNVKQVGHLIKYIKKGDF